MQPTSLLPLAFVLLTAGAAAQTLSANRTVLEMTSTADQAGCPVGLEAHHGSSLLQRKAIDGRAIDPGMNADQPGQQIHLKMTNQRSQDVVSLEITVHGLSSRPRLIPTSAAPYKADLIKKVHLTNDVKPYADAITNLVFRHFTTVTLIHLDAVAYADGSVWRAPSQQACSVTPGEFMLASAH